MILSKRFKTVFWQSFAICAVALILLEKDITRSIKLHSRQSRFVTSSGVLLTTFFAGLPPNEKIRESVLHPKRPEVPACQQSSGTVSRIMNALGLGQVVYAQPACDLSCLGCAEDVQSIVCTECGTGNFTKWYGGNFSQPATGHQCNGQIACGTNETCGYNYRECINANC
jgi:hypothetical protein